jgi:hypothetical protein
VRDRRAGRFSGCNFLPPRELHAHSRGFFLAFLTSKSQQEDARMLRRRNIAMAIAALLGSPVAAFAADRLLVLSKAESKLAIVDPHTLERWR